MGSLDLGAAVGMGRSQEFLTSMELGLECGGTDGAFKL
jgi:hypothetical protein